MGQGRYCELEPIREILRWLQSVGQVDSGSFTAPEVIAGLVELETQLEVRDRVRCHQKLVAVETGQEVLRDVVVPEGFDSRGVVGLGLPLGHHRLVDEVDGLDEESACTACWIENLNEVLAGRHVSGNGDLLVTRSHFTPGDCVCETIGEPKFRP